MSRNEQLKKSGGQEKKIQVKKVRNLKRKGAEQSNGRDNSRTEGEERGERSRQRER